MAKVASFHTNSLEYLPKHREVYHDKNTCPDGKKIRTKHRAVGYGDKKHCSACDKVA
ncbi:MAG: hypothetical protein ABI818_17600 [Acidobacteriota bacterium]